MGLKSICFFSFLFLVSIAYSQNPKHDSVFFAENQHLRFNPFDNAIILKHYTVQELKNYQINDSLKFKMIAYYYTQSFSVEKMTCDECPDFNPETFDVSDYEYLRDKEKVVSRGFYKYGFKLTLIPISKLKYKLPIHYSK